VITCVIERHIFRDLHEILWEIPELPEPELDRMWKTADLELLIEEKKKLEEDKDFYRGISTQLTNLEKRMF